ncbi:MAG: DNA polymerase III subunit delta [Lachnospiraceae bacterium]|nr:DNA polymerase III subunit delta [Lachnospiraceae bacterium]
MDGKVKNIILICGDEEYLKTEKKKEILSFLGTEGSPDFNAFEGKDTDYQEVFDLARTVPFFGGNRTILLSDTGLFKGNPDESVYSSLDGLPEFTFMIFVEQDCDSAGKLTKLVKQKGEIYKYSTVDSTKDWKAANAAKADIRTWIRSYLKEAGCTADSRAIEELTNLSGYNMQNLKTELDKLISYAGRNIRIEHVDTICSKTVSDRVFDMVDLKLSGSTEKALLLLEDMLSIRIEPMRILYMLEKQFNQVYIIKELSELRYSDAEILSRTGIKDWQLRKLRDKSKGRSLMDMRCLTELCIEMETRVKQGDIGDRMAVEIILCS